jgi:hypothetical protein
VFQWGVGGEKVGLAIAIQDAAIAEVHDEREVDLLSPLKSAAAMPVVD